MLWPGPLTMIVPATEAVPREVTGGRDTVAIRVPEHQLTLQVVSTLDGAVAAPSANRFGRVSPTTAQHVIDDIGDILDPDRDAILDGGPCLVGVESTIVDLTCDPPQILRPGGVPSPLLDRLLEPVDGSSIVAATGPARASGMLPSHYAPERGVVLVEREDRETLDQLKNVPVFASLSDGGEAAVPLSALADFRLTAGPRSVERENHRAKVTVSANLTSPRAAFRAMGMIGGMMGSFPLPPGYEWSFGRWNRFQQQDQQTSTFLWIFAGVLV